MKISIEINEEDMGKFKRIAHVDDAFSALDDISQYLREQWKYAEEPDDIETIRERVFDILQENGIIMDDLWR